MPIEIENPTNLPSEFRIFYAWQSQSPTRTNKNLIRNSILQAIVRVEEELPEKLDLAIVLDSDTTGRAGSPDIADAIMSKIAVSQVVIVDVSIVSRDEETRAYPNPNTLVELGYAAGKHGWARVVNVFNTALGTLEELPFDIRGRRIMGFHCPKGQDTSSEKKKLAGELYLAISTIIKQIGRGQLLADDHELERTKRARDVLHLKEMMATIDSSVMDELSGPHEDLCLSPALIDHWILFNRLVSASKFRFYDQRLIEVVERLKKCWKEYAYVTCVVQEEDRESDDPGSWDEHYLAFLDQQGEDELWNRLCDSVPETDASYRRVLEFVHEHYPEIDLRETDSLAREARRR